MTGLITAEQRAQLRDAVAKEMAARMRAHRVTDKAVDREVRRIIKTFGLDRAADPPPMPVRAAALPVSP